MGPTPWLDHRWDPPVAVWVGYGTKVPCWNWLVSKLYAYMGLSEPQSLGSEQNIHDKEKVYKKKKNLGCFWSNAVGDALGTFFRI